MKVLDLCSGIGGFSLGLTRAGMRTTAFCEIEEYPRSILRKHWPDVPIFEDLRKLHAEDLPEAVDLICAGFPCQPFSLAGKRKGADDDRHLWPEIVRIIREPDATTGKPTWCIFENVPGLISMGLDTVLSDLENEGYACWPFVVPACAVNAPHRRDRVWIVANASRQLLNRCRQSGAAGRNEPTVSRCAFANTDAKHGDIPGLRAGQIPQQQEAEVQENFTADTSGTGSQERISSTVTDNERHFARSDFERITTTEWITERPICRTHDGVSERLDKDIVCLRDVLPHGMVGKTSIGGASYAEKNNTRPTPELRVLRGRIEEKDIQWKDGRQNEIFEAEILREAMFWFSNGERRSEQDHSSSKSQESLERFLRELRYEEKPSCSSRRWERGEQCEKEYQDIVFLLSLEMALAEWENHAEKTVVVQNLWRACEEIGFMSKTLHEVKNSWRSMPYEEKRWCVICAGTGDRFHDWWPGVGGVSTEKIPNRAARLKALGNAVVPQIPELIGKIIIEIENK